MNTNTNTTAVSAEQTVIAQYREDWLRFGLAKTVVKWAAPLLDAWTDTLDGRPVEQEGWKHVLATLMGETLSIRDIAIVAAIDPTVSRDTLLQIASHPQDAETCAVMGRIMDDSFNNPDLQPDAKRLETAVDELARMADETNGTYGAHALAAAAYIAWWAGDLNRASRLVAATLSADPTVSLATLTAYCLAHGINPAYRR